MRSPLQLRSITAEAVKILENTFRAVNIALVNEAENHIRGDADNIFEVIEAAKTKPLGFMPFYPGPGLGGHCIPIAPFYLAWKAREYGINSRFIELAGEINSEMPDYVIAQLAMALDQPVRPRTFAGERARCGAAYKKNVDDMRESPALVIISQLKSRGTRVDYYDPLVPRISKLASTRN